MEEITIWVCNECDAPNYSDIISEEDMKNELLSCCDCGSFEFHKETS